VFAVRYKQGFYIPEDDILHRKMLTFESEIQAKHLLGPNYGLNCRQQKTNNVLSICNLRTLKNAYDFRKLDKGRLQIRPEVWTNLSEGQ
jgi:hypothetical protein